MDKPAVLLTNSESDSMRQQPRPDSDSTRASPRWTPSMTQPESMKTTKYAYGVDVVNGYDAWAMFKACAAGDSQKVESLIAKDKKIVNAQFWYQFPIHMAVRKGNAELVKRLLDQGADPGRSGPIPLHVLRLGQTLARRAAARLQRCCTSP